MTGPGVLVYADDLSGALDTAVTFRGRGDIAVLLPERSGGGAGGKPMAAITVIDTESRHLPPEEAARAVLAEMPQTNAFSHVYKKVDSVLRGNPGVETLSLLQAFHRDVAVVAPSYPDNGRTVVQGRLFVGGMSVKESAAAADPKNPIADDRVHDLLKLPKTVHSLSLSLHQIRSGARAILSVVEEARRHRPAIIIADAVDTDDLELLGDVLAEMPGVLPVGSAGLARALAARWGRPVPLTPWRPNPLAKVLVVVGTRHPLTRRQLALLTKDRQVPFYRLAPDQEPERIWQDLKSRSMPGVAVVATPEERWPHERARQMLDTLGEIAARWVNAHPKDAMVVASGGETAYAVVRALEASILEPLGEFSPGVVVSRGNGRSDFILVTKSGGFGDDEALVQTVCMLSSSVNG